MAVSKCSEDLLRKCEGELTAAELTARMNDLIAHYAHLMEILPADLRGATGLERHHGWMRRNVKEGAPWKSKSDVRDICLLDLPRLREELDKWFSTGVRYDPELVEKLSALVAQGQYDSAIRKAFVILKGRLVIRFSAPENLDGPQLVNAIFGRSGSVAAALGEDERQAMRDLLSGLYGVFRNKYGHQDAVPKWDEADAVLSCINHMLFRLDAISEKLKRTPRPLP